MIKKHALAILSTSWAFLAPVHTTIIITLVLIIVDLITGILAARKRGEPISSAGIRRTVVKLFVYELAIVLAFLVETHMHVDIPMIKLLSGFIGITELKSCLENLDTINGSSVIKDILQRLGSANQNKP
jgi:phage-related holin